MENTNLDISKTSTNELKVMVYDLSKGIANYQNAIQIIEKELSTRQVGQQPAVASENGVDKVPEVAQISNN